MRSTIRTNSTTVPPTTTGMSTRAPWADLMINAMGPATAATPSITSRVVETSIWRSGLRSLNPSIEGCNAAIPIRVMPAIHSRRTAVPPPTRRSTVEIELTTSAASTKPTPPTNNRNGVVSPVDTRSIRHRTVRSTRSRMGAARATASSTASRLARCTMGSRMKIHATTPAPIAAIAGSMTPRRPLPWASWVTHHSPNATSIVATDRNGPGHIAADSAGSTCRASASANVTNPAPNANQERCSTPCRRGPHHDPAAADRQTMAKIRARAIGLAVMA